MVSLGGLYRALRIDVVVIDLLQLETRRRLLGKPWIIGRWLICIQSTLVLRNLELCIDRLC